MVVSDVAANCPINSANAISNLERAHAGLLNRSILSEHIACASRFVGSICITPLQVFIFNPADTIYNSINTDISDE